MRIAGYFSAASALVVLAACSSSGTFHNNVDLSRYQNVYVSKSIGVFDQRYLPPVVEALQKDGFTVVDSPKAPDTVTLKFATDTANMNHYRVAIQLWANDKLVIDAESKNSRSNLAASEAPLRDLVSRATAEMQKEIQSNIQAHSGNAVPLC